MNKVQQHEEKSNCFDMKNVQIRQHISTLTQKFIIPFVVYESCGSGAMLCLLCVSSYDTLLNRDFLFYP